MSKTIQQLLQSSKKIGRLDAELLIAQVIKKKREFVLSHPEYEISKLKNWQITNFFEKRFRGIPLAYLTKHKEFFGLEFFVNKNVLVPRPDTEILVESVINHIHNSKFINHNSTIIDIGTGSGCIPISILKSLSTNQLANTQTFATDISKKALRVAKKNAKRHDVKINFLHGNLLKPLLTNRSLITDHQSLVITANLPYLTEEQLKQEPSIQHEPRLALVARKSGLELYHKLLEQIQSLLINHQLQLTAFFEIDPKQPKPITKLIKKYLPNAKIEIKPDLAGLDRIVIIKT